MKKSLKVLALVMMLVFSITAIYAYGRPDEVTTTSSSNTNSTTKTTSNKNTGKLYTELPAGTDGSAGTSAKYVLFGEWPQTIMAEGVTIDKTKTRQQGAFTYYKGSDGAWYYEGEENSYDYFKYGDGYLGIECLYSDGSPRMINDYAGLTDEELEEYGVERITRFFKVEPIKWRVLSENYQGNMLLLPEVILTAGIPYNENYRDDEYDNDYETSSIRAYLNGIPFASLYITVVSYEEDSFDEIEDDTYVGKGFLQTAFNADEQKAIAVTHVDNSLEQCYEPDEEIPEVLIEYRELFELDNTDTDDKVFLLSVKEIAEYMTEEALEYIEATDFALANGAFFFSAWWLRSPAWLSSWADYDGVIDYDDMQYDSVRKIVYGNLKTEYGTYEDTVDGYDYDDNCLVPAICIAK